MHPRFEGSFSQSNSNNPFSYSNGTHHYMCFQATFPEMTNHSDNEDVFMLPTLEPGVIKWPEEAVCGVGADGTVIHAYHGRLKGGEIEIDANESWVIKVFKNFQPIERRHRYNLILRGTYIHNMISLPASYPIYDSDAIFQVIGSKRGLRSLFDALDNNQVKSVKDRFEIACKILDIISILHNEYNIVHLDLKTDNFLVRKVGDAWEVYLIDCDYIEDMSVLSEDGDDLDSDLKYLDCRKGTKLFISPEMLHHSSAGFSSDIFTLSFILLELFGFKENFHNLESEEGLAFTPVFIRDQDMPDWFSNAHKSYEFLVNYFDLFFKKMHAYSHEARPTIDECAHFISALDVLRQESNDFTVKIPEKRIKTITNAVTPDVRLAYYKDLAEENTFRNKAETQFNHYLNKLFREKGYVSEFFHDHMNLLCGFFERYFSEYLSLDMAKFRLSVLKQTYHDLVWAEWRHFLNYLHDSTLDANTKQFIQELQKIEYSVLLMNKALYDVFKMHVPDVDDYVPFMKAQFECLPQIQDIQDKDFSQVIRLLIDKLSQLHPKDFFGEEEEKSNDLALITNGFQVYPDTFSAFPSSFTLSHYQSYLYGLLATFRVQASSHLLLPENQDEKLDLAALFAIFKSRYDEYCDANASPFVCKIKMLVDDVLNEFDFSHEESCGTSIASLQNALQKKQSEIEDMISHEDFRFDFALQQEELQKEAPKTGLCSPLMLESLKREVVSYFDTLLPDPSERTPGIKTLLRLLTYGDLSLATFKEIGRHADEHYHPINLDPSRAHVWRHMLYFVLKDFKDMTHDNADTKLIDVRNRLSDLLKDAPNSNSNAPMDEGVSEMKVELTERDRALFYSEVSAEYCLSSLETMMNSSDLEAFVDEDEDEDEECKDQIDASNPATPFLNRLDSLKHSLNNSDRKRLIGACMSAEDNVKIEGLQFFAQYKTKQKRLEYIHALSENLADTYRVEEGDDDPAKNKLDDIKSFIDQNCISKFNFLCCLSRYTSKTAECADAILELEVEHGLKLALLKNLALGSQKINYFRPWERASDGIVREILGEASPSP